MKHEEICTYEVAKLVKEKGFDWDCPMYYTPAGKLKYCWAHDPTNSGLDMRSMLCHNSRLPFGFGAECTAPTQSLLQRWLREEKGYYVYPFFDNDSRRWTWVCRELTGDMWIQLLDFEERYFNTYELALEDTLKYVLENLV